MKIRNEYVQVKIGNKEYTKRNIILNKYLKNLFLSQINTNHTNAAITHCFIKFDTPLENINYDSELRGFHDFDIALYTHFENREVSFVATTNSIKISYDFTTKYGFLWQNLPYEYWEFEQFVGRKITAIGFGNSGNVYAVVDTSMMNIKIDKTEEFRITRVDTIQSDGNANGYDYPLHLINDYKTHNNNKKAVLKSICYGNVEGLIEEEYNIEQLSKNVGDNYIEINTTRTKKVGHYPSEDLELGFYPTIDNSKYILLKYQLYEVDNENNVTMLDDYYTMNLKNEEDFGNLKLKLSIERK